MPEPLPNNRAMREMFRDLDRLSRGESITRRRLELPVWVWLILNGAIGGGTAYLFGELPEPWRWLIILALVLVSLIRRTGSEAFKSYATAGPATLAGPIQPWEVKHG
jgi:hypothetical protein